MKPTHLLLTSLAMAACLSASVQGTKAQTPVSEDGKITVIPYPNEVIPGKGSFNAAGAIFHVDPQLEAKSKNAIFRFAEALTTNSGEHNLITGPGRQNGFIFLKDETLAEEAYSIVSTKYYVEVRASSLRGISYAIETLKQLLPEQIYGQACRKGVDWSIPCLTINDAPRFSYRGMHLDVARHFYGVEDVKRYLDIMAFHKMNYFHWHLTDDQGWRIEIKKYPLLTEIGSVRQGTMIRKNWESCDNRPYGGFYTQEEIKEVINYAADRGISIIPEIDLPGHMLAALAAYPQYGCTGGPYKVWHRWGISDDVLCVGKEESMVFLENILEEVAALFPCEFIHIGGDECPKVRWKECPDCQAKIKELGLADDDKHSAEHYLQNYVTERIGTFLAGKGKRIIGWDEILEGKLQGDAIVMSWRGVDGGLEASRTGHDAIMTPNSHFYFDHYQSTDVENEPLAIGGYLPVRKCYAFEPYTKDMTDEQKAHILGVQANMWTEYIRNTDYLDYMLLPRMSALAEVQWCNPENKDWKRFVNSAESLFSRYDVLGYNYAVHMFDTLIDIKSGKEEGVVEVSLRANSNVPVMYSILGEGISSAPKEYTEPIRISSSCTLITNAEWKDGRGLPRILKFQKHKAMGASYTLDSKPDKQYKGNSVNLLTDGIRGNESFSSRDWTAWKDEDMQVTLTVPGKESYNSLTLSVNINKPSYIFNPEQITVSTSSDGVNFTEIARASYPTEGRNEQNGLKEYTLRFPSTAEKYLRVTAKPVSSLPEWHNGRGGKAFLFVDEIIVR